MGIRFIRCLSFVVFILYGKWTDTAEIVDPLSSTRPLVSLISIPLLYDRGWTSG